MCWGAIPGSRPNGSACRRPPGTVGGLGAEPGAAAGYTAGCRLCRTARCWAMPICGTAAVPVCRAVPIGGHRACGYKRKSRARNGAGLKGCNDLIFQVVTFLYRIIGNEKVTVYFQLIARKCRISNNRLQNMKNFRDWQILFDRRKNGWINKPLQQQLKN